MATKCNLCGNTFDMYDLHEGYGIKRKLGYGATHDGSFVIINICCSCMQKMIDECAIPPFASIGEADPA